MLADGLLVLGLVDAEHLVAGYVAGHPGVGDAERGGGLVRRASGVIA
jgi:hypothetical protein